MFILCGEQIAYTCLQDLVHIIVLGIFDDHRGTAHHLAPVFASPGGGPVTVSVGMIAEELHTFFPQAHVGDLIALNELHSLLQGALQVHAAIGFFFQNASVRNLLNDVI